MWQERSPQIRELEVAGADIVRVSCPDVESTKALREIVPEVTVPIVADIHFHYQRAIEAAESGAACLRLNPGNIGSRERVREVVQAAKDNNCSMRIGREWWQPGEGVAGQIRRALSRRPGRERAELGSSARG
jgi:4-hydroxy-3-methylbut-2-en-1-yl diphosphate synthase IspG/GcpE